MDTAPSRTRSSFTRRKFSKLLAAGACAAGMAATSGMPRAQGKKGGQLRMAVGHGSTTDNLDPATYLDYYTGTAFWGALSNSLTEVDVDGNITADMASSFEQTEKARKWIFRLRNGAEFHNGKSVRPEDVIASIRHHMGQSSKSAAKSILADIADLKADATSVVFTLHNPNADFPFLLSDWHLPIMPAKADGSADWSSGVRTGPYRLDRFEPGVVTRLKRNENYYRDAWFDEIEINAVIDPTARTNALLSGAVDFIDRCDLKTLAHLKRNSDIEVDEVTGYAHYMFVMNVTQAPFDRPEVRRALKYAIDRQAILDKVLLGHGAVGNDNPIAPSIKYAANPTPIHSYDPEKARSLLAKAGIDTLKIELSTAESAFAGAVSAAELFKDSAAKAGIEISVIREADDGFWDNVWMKKPFVAMYWNGRATCDWMFTTAYAADAAWNETFWKNDRFNELLIKARAESDDAVRRTMYAEMQQIVHDDGGSINFAFNNYVTAHSKRIAHGKLGANWDHDGMKLTQRWWQA